MMSIGYIDTSIRPIMGADPEIFIRDLDGKLMPAFSFLKDSVKKGNPFLENPVYEPYSDGFQAEWNNGHETCLDGFCRGIQRALINLRGASLGVAPKRKLTLEPLVEIPKDILEKCTDEQVALGCAPSSNIYGNMGQFPPDTRLLPVRMAGGHIHIGFQHENMWTKRSELVRALDRLVGVYWTAVMGKLESPIRRMYYGLAGEHRTPKHGLEYRVLSNTWLAAPATVHLITNLIRGVYYAVQADVDKFIIGDDDITQRIINELDVETARKMLEVNQDVFKTLYLVGGRGNFGTLGADIAYDVGMLGIEYLLSKPLDLEYNWAMIKPPEHYAKSMLGGVPWSWRAVQLSFQTLGKI